MNNVIEVENISKKYRISHEKAGLAYYTLRDELTDAVKKPFYLLTGQRKSKEDVWALKDISFNVEAGEILGLIGPNGSGKTTILKVLTRITPPSKGRAVVVGRVGSLLEVGTGFHPELTGRENVYLNGAILGMKKREIDRKFDEIVQFAEVEKFLDTPLKRYSSGMNVRLAFSVAAHLDPDILLMDEVLAVGDMAFQKKCLKKMEDVAKGGRTVLFVSHHMEAIRSLCKKVIWLNKGQIKQIGNTEEVVRNYEKDETRQYGGSFYLAKRDLKESKPFYVDSVEMSNVNNQRTTTFRYNDRLSLLVGFAGNAPERYSTEFQIHNELNQLVFMGESGLYHAKYFGDKVKKLKIDIGPLNLTSGKYSVLLKIMSKDACHDAWKDAISFTIIECQPFATNHEMPTYRDGVCVIPHSFNEII